MLTYEGRKLIQIDNKGNFIKNGRLKKEEEISL